MLSNALPPPLILPESGENADLRSKVRTGRAEDVQRATPQQKKISNGLKFRIGAAPPE